MEVTRKQSIPNFPKNGHFLLPDISYVCVPGGKTNSLLGKFGALYFLVTSVLRFALLRYYRRIEILALTPWTQKSAKEGVLLKTKLSLRKEIANVKMNLIIQTHFRSIW